MLLKRFKAIWKKGLLKLKIFAAVIVGKKLIHLLVKTCRLQMEGLENFCQLAATEKCMLMLWHNRLTVVPCILSRYTPQFLYAALVSGHGDGEVLSAMIHSYHNGRTIRSSPKTRYRALKDVIRHVEEGEQIVIITPDGPRGPLYEIKSGIAFAALETQACVIPLNWEAQKYWKLNSWDQQRIPKPFTTIRISFGSPIRFDQTVSPSLEEAKAILKNSLPIE